MNKTDLPESCKHCKLDCEGRIWDKTVKTWFCEKLELFLYSSDKEKVTLT